MSSFDKLVMGGGGDGGGRKRRRAAPTRPPFIAHPCTDWPDELVKKHLAACERGRDPATGEWAFTTDDRDASWAWLWETMGKPGPDGKLDFSPWPVVEVEVP